MAILQFKNGEILASEVAAIQLDEGGYVDVVRVILRSGKTFESSYETGKGRTGYDELVSAWHKTLGINP